MIDKRWFAIEEVFFLNIAFAASFF